MANVDRGGWLILHFGMTGALQFVRNRDEESPFTRVRVHFTNDGCFAYTKKRMIGHVGLLEDVADVIANEKLGPDALDRRFDFRFFKTSVLGIKRDVKSVLMDQKIIAGIGNIYSDEILFQARINPAELEPNQLKRLFLEILKTAVVRGAGGHSFLDNLIAGLG